MSSSDFYRHARAYDIAFGDRDFAAECNFLEWCWRAHGRLTQPPSPPSFLELACGPARHAREFGRRGWSVIGLDLSPDMLAYAAESAEQDNVTLRTVVADMSDFDLPAPVMLAANLMESITHLVTNEQTVSHLRAVARNLLPGGVFVIEMAHPAWLGRDTLPNMWTAHHGDTEVDVLFGEADDPYDWFTQVWQVTSRLTVRQAGRPAYTIESRHPHRWYLAQEFRALVDLSGAYEAAWWYGDMSIPPAPMDNGEVADQMIVVLRRRGG
ncbi:MAG: class I SAM-dependent methyltransferase [Anaerolineae bacterium]|nr:class I SAM-dependent methyltransferase [Thermoflexales bacterium]MDW8408062.1 class I SAM-dependent methyltransferase [Anaerolineae bacterium]